MGRESDNRDAAQLAANDGAGVRSRAARAIGLDVKTELLRRVRKTLFDAAGAEGRGRHGGLSTAARAVAAHAAPRGRASACCRMCIRSSVRCTTPSGTFGYVRLATFAPEDERDDPDMLIDWQ